MAFSTPSKSTKDLFSLKAAGEESDIRIVTGLERADAAVRDGISNFLSTEKGDWIISLLNMSEDRSSPDAYDLQDELSDGRLARSSSKLVRLLSGLETRGFPSSRAFFFAATDWAPEDEAMFLGGSTKDLLSYLQLVRTTGLWLWLPQSKLLQDSDRYPLIFHLNSRGNGS